MNDAWSYSKSECRNLYHQPPSIEAELHAWAMGGIEDLERYLAAYAAWSEWESRHD